MTVKPVYPPAQLLEECLVARDVDIKVWQDTLYRIIDLEEALADCNLKLEALRSWQELNKGEK
jgi:hypothetical protein